MLRDGVLVPASSAAAFDGAVTGWYYDGTARITWVRFPLESSQGTTVALE